MSEAKIIGEMPEEINAEESIKKSINYMLDKLPESKLWRVLSYIQKIR